MTLAPGETIARLSLFDPRHPLDGLPPKQQRIYGNKNLAAARAHSLIRGPLSLPNAASPTTTASDNLVRYCNKPRLPANERPRLPNSNYAMQLQ